MPSVNRLSPTGHSFGRPPLLASENSIALHSFTGSQTFQPVPPATGAYPYRLALGDVIGADPVNAIVTAGSMTFHVMGDTGGVAQPAPQQIVAQKLDADVAQPAFLYLLGDCIYYNGELSQYPQQFYEPYAHYSCFALWAGDPDLRAWPGQVAAQCGWSAGSRDTPGRKALRSHG